MCFEEFLLGADEGLRIGVIKILREIGCKGGRSWGQVGSSEYEKKRVEKKREGPKGRSFLMNELNQLCTDK